MSPIIENKETDIKLQMYLEEQLWRRDLLWGQKAKEPWLREGGKNAKIFCLSSTIIRSRNNHIATIKDETGNWTDDQVRYNWIVSWKPSNTYFKQLIRPSSRN